MPAGKKITAWELEAIVRKCMEGKTVDQIAYEVNRPAATVYSVRERYPLFCLNPILKGDRDATS